MNKVIYGYIVKNYLKIVFNMTLVFFGVVILLNLFQEIEFFKDLDVGFQLPLTLTIMLAPNIVIKIFPFIIFFSAMWYLVSINNNKELLTLKVFGISNLYIAGSSVFTTSSIVNPTYTIIALSLRLGEHLKNIKL